MVIAVEPDPAFAHALRLTFNPEIASGRVIVVEGAIAPFGGTIRLQTGGTDVFGSRVSSEGGLQVKSFTLDDIVQNHDIRDLSFIKMDIEGGEVDAWQGASMVLNKLRPNLSVAVYHTESAAGLLRTLLGRVAPHYRVRFRGAWLRDRDTVRPYMLLAKPRQVQSR